MKILLWHGYLLTGSGSNVYTANLVRSWREDGHDVLLMCQERHPERLREVDEAGDFSEDNTRFVLTREPSARAALGRCRLLRPNLGGLLPVYVYDDYEGFEVKTFVDLTDDELRDYTDRNVAAMNAAARWFEPEVVITGHEVMGPYIALRAGEATGFRYSAKLHGSGLEYAVKMQDRYRGFASGGLGAAHRVIGGSRYMVREAARYIPGWLGRAAVVNPGCDVDMFRPRPRSGSVPTVGFVGKLIAAKGVHHLLAALPLTQSARRALIVGYGGFEDGLRALAEALSSGDLEAAGGIASRGENGPLPHLLRLIEEPPAGYVEAARDVEIEFTGRLEHGPLAEVLPGFDTLVVPSVIPEAFGMVAAEAAAAGVLSIVPNHSGIAEAGAAIEERLGRPGFLTFDADDPIGGIADAIDRVLGVPLEERAALEEAAVSLARDRWAWGRVADQLLRVAAS